MVELEYKVDISMTVKVCIEHDKNNYPVKPWSKVHDELVEDVFSSLVLSTETCRNGPIESVIHSIKADLIKANDVEHTP